MKKQRTPFCLMIVALLLATGTPTTSRAYDLGVVPGKVIYYTPSPSWLDALLGNEKYTSDPEIIVLPNGWYLMCHRTFGNLTDDTLRIYKSTDKGTNWSQIVTFPNASSGHSFFLHNNELYLMGGETIIKSTDNGTSWTPAYSKTSFIVNGTTNYSTWTPNNPVEFNGRVWSAASTKIQSAPSVSNLLNGASWKWSGSPGSDANWLDGQFTFMTEAQVVASPEQGVVILPKTNLLPYSALIRGNKTTGNLTFDPVNDFVELPGAEKKFGAAYDAVSGKFFVLSNPVLPATANDPNLDPNLTAALIRNTAAVLTSRDLYNWKVEKIFLYTANVNYEAFQYFNFDFDGDTMVVASRTAFDVGDTYKPPRGHDSNLITFHTISDFRNLSPNHVLKLSGGSVLRYEKTQHTDAPLGAFALGSSFDGSPLTSPNGFGRKASTGDIYIRETGGRILRFDAAGNFLEVVASSPVSFQTSALTVTQPANGECSWSASGSGDWSEPLNWYYWGRPDTSDEIAVFGSALGSASTISVKKAFSLKGLRFNSHGKNCTFSGTGSITLAAASGNGIIDIEQGAHAIQIPVSLNSDADILPGTGTSLTLSDDLRLNGHVLNVEGSGDVAMNTGVFSMDGGSLLVGAGSTIAFTNVLGIFDGTLELAAPSNFNPSAGDTFHVIEGDVDASTFNQILLPTLQEGLAWDTSSLFSIGNVSVILKVPASWMADYGLPQDGSADFIDSDGDGQDNYAEWKAGTNPTNMLSFFSFDASGSLPVETGFQLRWNSLTGRTYRVETSTNLTDNPPFTVLQTGIPGEAGLTEFIDTNTAVKKQSYYRVYVE
ncbi:MAG: glycoside hydrolase [Kiritimatiellales bacterium]|nr:glycoside hydrolase [Kiritimatiellales bacterium]